MGTVRGRFEVKNYGNRHAMFDNDFVILQCYNSHNMKNNQKGFIVPFLLIIITLVFAGGGLYMYEQSKPSAVGSPTIQLAPTTQDQNQLAQQQLDLVRLKTRDAVVKSALLSIRTESQINYSEAGGNTYTGLCAYPKIVGYLSDAKTANGGTAPTCNSSAKAYATMSPLATDSKTFWCLDSTGFSGTVTAPLGTNTACTILSAASTPITPAPYVRSRVNDLFIEDQLSTIKYGAQTYYSATGNNSTAIGNTYIGVCTKSTRIVEALTVARSANGGTMPTCNTSVTAYAVSSPLSTDSTIFYCVDSKGFDGKTTTPLGTSTVCPAQ